jgi:hypothetical protein
MLFANPVILGQIQPLGRYWTAIEGPMRGQPAANTAQQKQRYEGEHHVPAADPRAAPCGPGFVLRILL